MSTSQPSKTTKFIPANRSRMSNSKYSPRSRSKKPVTSSQAPTSGGSYVDMMNAEVSAVDVPSTPLQVLIDVESPPASRAVPATSGGSYADIMAAKVSIMDLPTPPTTPPSPPEVDLITFDSLHLPTPPPSPPASPPASNEVHVGSTYADIMATTTPAKSDEVQAVSSPEDKVVKISSSSSDVVPEWRCKAPKPPQSTHASTSTQGKKSTRNKRHGKSFKPRKATKPSGNTPPAKPTPPPAVSAVTAPAKTSAPTVQVNSVNPETSPEISTSGPPMTGVWEKKLWGPEPQDGKVYGIWKGLKGDPEKLERLNQQRTFKLESRWAPAGQ